MSHKQAKAQRRAERQRNPHGVEFGDLNPKSLDPMTRQLWTETTPADLDAEDDASDADRLWFEAHPHHNQRIRDPYPGEFRAATPPGRYCADVAVVRLGPGLRARFPRFLPLPQTH